MKTVLFPNAEKVLRYRTAGKNAGGRYAGGSKLRRITTVVERIEQAPHFEMTVARKRAAWLLAEDYVPVSKIAEELDVNLQTLNIWRKHPDFAAAVAEYEKEIFDEIKQHGLAVTEKRVRMAQEILDSMVALVHARAEAGAARIARGVGEPGEETGLLAEIPLKNGGTMMAFDSQLTKEIRETLKYAAQELGQFQSRVDVTSGGQTITFTISMADDGHEPTAIEGEWTVGSREERVLLSEKAK